MRKYGTIFLILANIVCAAETKRVALCYFGLPRTLNVTYPFHVECLFHPLDTAGVEYDIFMHTWRLEGKQYFQIYPLDIPINYNDYQILQPKYYRIDDQDAFVQTLDFKQYFYQDVWDRYGDDAEKGEWVPQLIKNHLCALESQKRVTEMVENSGIHYDYVIYVRPDSYFEHPLNMQTLLSLHDGEIMVPNDNFWEGYNDRFAMLTFKNAPIYGKRIDHLAEYRKSQGRIVSEKYLKYACDAGGLTVHPIDFPVHNAKLTQSPSP